MAISRRNAVLGVMAVVVASRVAGLIREMVVAHEFGTSAEYDLFLLGSMFPVLVASVVDFAAFYLAVPLLTRSMRSDDGRVVLDKSVWPTVNLTLGFAAAISITLAALAPYLVYPYVTGLVPEHQAQVVFYARLMAALIFFGACGSFYRAMLNAREVFAYAAGGQLVDNLVLILSVIFLTASLGGTSLAVGLLVGSALQAIYLGLRTTRWRPFKSWTMLVDRETIQTVFNALGILLIVEVINRSYFLIDRWFAVPFGEGIVAALNYSQVLVQVPDSIVGFAIASVAFPLFSATAIADPQQFARAYYRSIVIGLMVAIPIAVVFFTATADIVQILFLRGNFDETSLAKTVAVVQPWIPAVVALFVVSTSLRACYAAGWARQVLGAAVLAVAVKIIGTYIFVERFGYHGISAATSMAQIVFALGLASIVVRKIARPIAGRLSNSVVRISIAGTAALLVVVFLGNRISETFAGQDVLTAVFRLLVTSAITLAAYLVVLVVIGPRDDLKQLIGLDRSAKGKV